MKQRKSSRIFRLYVLMTILSLLTSGQATGKSNDTNTVHLPLVQKYSRYVPSISAGYAHTCTLTASGGVKCWGVNVYGQLGDGTVNPSTTPVDVSGLSSGVAMVSANWFHTCAVTTSGGVMCWGYNNYGQLGNGTTNNQLAPVGVVGLGAGVVAVAAGEFHTCALTASGGVKCWGANGTGRLGDGTTDPSSTPVDVAGLGSGVAAITAGGFHTCALMATGGVKCWGFNLYGQVGDGTTDPNLTPVDVVGLGSGVTAISAGGVHTCALIASGGVKCWGDNQVGQLGDGTKIQHSTPVDVVGLSSGVAMVSAEGYNTCALTSLGGVKCWGDNMNGQLGDGTSTGSLIPVDVVDLDSGVAMVAVGWDHTCVQMVTGGVKCWGVNWAGQLGDGVPLNRLTPVDVVSLGGVAVKIDAGQAHTCALTAAGGLKCWGSNRYGQVGDGTANPGSMPVDVTGLGSGVVAVTAGSLYTCALITSGGVKCWGYNGSGSLGDGTDTDRWTPVDVAGLGSGAAMVSAGSGHSCALTSTGGLKCWGDNNYGELGDGTTNDSLTPVDVVGLGSGVAMVSAGGLHTCALTTAGGVKCWGRNENGQLGDSTTNDNLTPVDVPGLGSGVAAIVTGSIHTCALTTAGGVKCWGYNGSGALGDGTKTDRLSPVDVVDLGSGVTAVAAGTLHTCALTSSGGVKCWGYNYYGGLGDGTTTPRLTPVDVVDLGSGVAAVDAGALHTCALTASGGVKCWGDDSAGQLGNGRRAWSAVPGNVIGLGGSALELNLP